MPVAIVPVRSFRRGMQRLSAILEPGRRADLGVAVAGHVIAAVRTAGLVPIVVTADMEVGEWATGLGVEKVADPEKGLDAAASAGVTVAEGRDEPWVVVHADLPILDAGELEPVVAAMKAGRPVIAPSADGGTSLLSSPARVAFSYGEGSFLRHIALLDDPEVIVTDGLLHDVDSPEDLEKVLAHDRGRWLEGIY